MPESELTCSRCGSAYPAAAFGGACPRCLMGAATTVSGGARFDVLPAEELNGVLTEYEVAELVGTGGMGAVYRARQMDLDREVAIKLLSPEAGGDPEFAERFAREAKVLGALAHPNIVPVYGIGFSDDGLPFYSMKLVKGRTLQEIIGQLREGDAGSLKTYPLAALLTIFRKVCDAMAFAHSQGILHRDLKPANVMVGEFGEVLVMDWGLAKMTKPEGQNPKVPVPEIPSGFGIPASSFTLSGAVLGTPQYMSPEQARGESDSLDERTDIFSLGGILYAILTLRPPVEGSTMAELLEKARSGSVVAPTKHGSTVSGSGKKAPGAAAGTSAVTLRHLPGGRVPAALSAVVMKAMTREMAGRYQTVSALSADVEAWQGGYATSAEKAGTWTQLKLLMRRHRIVTSMLALLLAVSAGFVIKVLASERHATENAELATANAGLAQRNESTALASLAESHVSAGLEADSPAMAALLFDRAAAVAPSPEARITNRVRTAEWSREATRVIRAFMVDGEPESIALHPTGRFLRIMVRGEPRLFDVAAEKPVQLVAGAKLLSAGWSPVTGVLAAATDAEAALVLYDVPALTVRAKLPMPGKSGGPVIFSDDGSMVAAGVEECRVWRVSDGQLLCTAKAPSGQGCRPVCLSPDGTRLIVRSGPDSLCLFPIQSGGGSVAPLLPPFAFHEEAGPGAQHAPPAFIPRTAHFLHTRKSTQPNGFTELVWRDATTGAEFKSLPGFEYYGGLSPDGVTFAGRIVPFTGTFETATGAPFASMDYVHHIHHSCFNADGSRLLFACPDIPEIPVFNGIHLMEDFAMQREGACRAAWSANGSMVAIARRSGLIQIISFAPLPPPPGRIVSLEVTGLPPAGQTAQPVIHPGGRFVALGGSALIHSEGKNTRSRVMDIATGAAAGPVMDPGGFVLGGEFSPDGDTLALLSTAGYAERTATQFLPGGKAGNVQLWDWRTGTRRGDPIPVPSEPRCIIYREGIAYVWCGGGHVVKLDPATRSVTSLFQTKEWQPLHVANGGRIAFSPDGGALFAWQQGSLVTAWDLAAARHRFPPVKTGAACADLAFLPGSGTSPGVFATVEFYSDPAYARFFDSLTGQPVASPIPLGSHASTCRFSADGSRLLVATIQDGTVALYDWRAGTVMFPEVQHRGAVHSAVFIPGTSWCISGDSAGEVRLWDGDTGKLILPPLTHSASSGIHDIKVTPGGHHVLYSPHAGGELRILDTGRLREDSLLSAEGQQLLCEVNACATYQAGGSVALDVREWFQRWEKLRALHPNFHVFPTADAYAPLAPVLAGQNAPIVVAHGNDSGPGSLRAALTAAAQQGRADTIIFASALSGQVITLASPVSLTDAAEVTVDATALPRGLTITDSGGTGCRLFQVAAGTVAHFHGLTFKDGGGSGVSRGGTFENHGTLNCTRCTFTGNQASAPGDTLGGAIYSEGPLSLSHCTLSGNQASGGSGAGGAIRATGSTLTLTHCTIAGNAATTRGGGVSIHGTRLHLDNCIIAGNSSPALNSADMDNNGAVSFVGTSIVPLLATDTMDLGTPPAGNGAILSTDPLLAPLGDYGGPTPTMPPLPGSPAINPFPGTTATSYTTDQRGTGFPRMVGGIVDLGAVEHLPPLATVPPRILTVNTTEDEDDGPETGGLSLREAIATAPARAIIVFDPALGGKTIRLLKSGTTTPYVGASGLIIAGRSSGLTIDASALPGGLTLTDAGAATYRLLQVQDSLLILRGLTFRDGGIGTHGSASGGALASQRSTVIIERCTFTGNISDGGGAIFAEYCTMALRHCTLTGNTTTIDPSRKQSGDGGAIFSYNNHLSLSHCTVSGNTAPAGMPGAGGILSFEGRVALSNCIVAGNTISNGTEPGDVRCHNDQLITSGTNLISAYSVRPVSLTNHGVILSAAPLLGPLADNGGPAPTMALLPGSPGIDAAIGSSNAVDQRGFSIAGPPDIGAFEAGGSAPAPAPAVTPPLPER